MIDLIADTKLALELEEKGYGFYTGAAQQTENKLIKAVFQGLAERELIHKNRITQIYQELTNTKRLPANWLKEAAVTPAKAALMQPILKLLAEALKNNPADKTDQTTTYKIAEELERNSFALYQKISQETDNPVAKQFYAALAKEEDEHFAILEDTLLYLNNPGDWFKKEEHWIVDGVGASV